METIKVKILEPRAKRLLHELENLKLIEIEKGRVNRPTKRRFGSMKGLVEYVADDFDAPLDDLKEYM